MEKNVSPLEELFLGREVEIVLEDYSAANPPPGVTFPNEGVLIGFDGNGVVLQRKRGKSDEQVAFFPYTTIRCIRRKVSAAVQLVADADPLAPPAAANRLRKG